MVQYVTKLLGVILDFNSLGPDDLQCEELTSLAHIDWQIYPHTRDDQVLDRIQHATIIMTNKVVLDERLIEQAQNLKYIGVLATGMNNIDRGACERRGILVQNIQAYGVASVAQHTLMLMLMLATSVSRYQDSVNNAQWSSAPQFCLLDYPVIELNSKHLVILGYGELGQAVAKLADAFGMRVSVAKRVGDNQDSYYELNGSRYARQSLDDLLPDADFVSLHCVSTPDNQQLINRDRLNLMASNGFLINTARGALVDEGALLESLQCGNIAGAGLDVLSSEPPPSDHPLLTAKLPNLIVTPHTAWSATEARQRLLDTAVSHLQNFLLSVGCSR